MTSNVDNFGHPISGQPNDTIGQDETVNTDENSNENWEEQAKYFQSEKDKLQVENQKLKGYEEVGRFLESRPDIVNTIKEQVGGQPNQKQSAIKPEDFDPWEAYNDPSSASYKFRMHEMQSTVNQAVTNATEGIRQETGRTKLESELANKGMSTDEINSFVGFADKHPAEYGLDNVIKMWRAVSQTSAQENTDNPLNQIRGLQGQPQTGGVLQGQRPLAPKSDTDAMWESVLVADRGSKLP